MVFRFEVPHISEVQHFLASFLLMVFLWDVSAEENPCSLVGSGPELHYATTAKGDRICDFSYAGYRAGGVALPDVPGTFIRAEESSESTSWSGVIARFDPDLHAYSMNSQAKPASTQGT